jgi:hypothetical protein
VSISSPAHRIFRDQTIKKAHNVWALIGGDFKL